MKRFGWLTAVIAFANVLVVSAPFARSEREVFMKLLARLTTELNDESRTPLEGTQRR